MKGKHIVILGFARQGRALARFLVTHGAHVTVSDMNPNLDTSGFMSVRFVLGQHPSSLLDGCDALALSGGIPNNLPIVLEAQRRAIPLTNDAQLFVEHCAARIVGITGSAGKTTTTTLAHRMLAESRLPGRLAVGGNIGNPLIEQVEAFGQGDTVVMELSSFQLELMRQSPPIACITNITPNHLDRHPSMEHYAAAKINILRWQTAENIAVLNADDARTSALQPTGRVAWFSLSKPPVDDGAWCDANGTLHARVNGETFTIAQRTSLKLRGDHNVSNVLAAAVLARHAGANASAIQQVAANFAGVAHRLELVRERNGVRWYNDSIATAPERVIAGLRSFDEPVVLLLCGRDKQLPWTEAVRVMSTRCRHVVVFGELSGLVSEVLRAHAPQLTYQVCAGLAGAVRAAADVALSGDVVLLSPGGTSFDQFSDFAQRGDAFRAEAQSL